MAVRLRLRRSASKFISDFPSLKDRIEKALADIRIDPFVDGETKFMYPAPPIVATLYERDGLWVLYTLDDDCKVASIWNIGLTGSKVEINHL